MGMNILNTEMEILTLDMTRTNYYYYVSLFTYVLVSNGTLISERPNIVPSNNLRAVDAYLEDDQIF